MSYRVIGETLGARTYESDPHRTQRAALKQAAAAIRQNNLARDGGPAYRRVTPGANEVRRWERGRVYAVAVERCEGQS